MGFEDQPPAIEVVYGPALGDARVTQAQQEITEAQSLTDSQDGKLAERGTDDDYVQTEDRFEGMSHEQMYAAVHGTDGSAGMNVQGLRSLATIWQELAGDVMNGFAFHQVGMHRIFGDGLWKGDAATAAEAASMRFATAGNKLGRVLSSVSSRYDAMTWTAEATRQAVQPPPTGQPAQILPGLVSGESARQLEEAKEEARMVAVTALNTIYKPNYPTQGAGVPAYVPVPTIGAGVGGTEAGGGGGIGGGTGGGPGMAGPGVEAPGAAPPETAPSAANGPGATSPASVAESTAGLMDKALASQSGGPGAPATTPAGLGSGSGVGGGAGTGAGASGGGVGGIGPGSGSGGPGSGGPGTKPGAPTPGSGGAGASSAGAGSGGVGARPMGGPMAPGAGARKQSSEDEAEHRAPEYLRGIQPDWNEGLDNPAGVIGDDQAPALDYSGTDIAEPGWPTSGGHATDWTTQPSSAQPAESAQLPSVSPQPVTSHDFGSSPQSAAAPPPATPPMSATTSEPLRFGAPDSVPDRQPDTVVPHPEAATPQPQASAPEPFSGTGLDLTDLAAEYGWEHGSDDAPASDDNPPNTETPATEQ